MAQDIQKYWSVRHELAMIDGMAIKDKRIIILYQLQREKLNLLYSSYIGIGKMRLLVCKSVYQINMNTDIENTLKHCSTCLEYQNMQLQDKVIPYRTLTKPLELVGTDIFMVKNETLLYIVHHHSKYQVVKRVDGLLAEDLIWATKVVFAKLSQPINFIFDVGKNFVSE